MQSLFAQFQTRYPSGGLITELLTIHDGNYVVRALVNVGDRAIATGMAAASTVEAAEDQARLRALQVFNQLSNPIGLPESPALAPHFFSAGLPIQPSLQANVAAANTSVAAANTSISSGANVATDTDSVAATNIAPSIVRPAQSPPAQSPPIQSPIVPIPVNPVASNGGGNGVSSASLAVPAAPQPVPSPASEPANAPKLAVSSASSPTSEDAEWSIELSEVPDSTLSTHFSSASVSSSTATRPVADLYAAATEESVTQSWDRPSTATDQPKSSDLDFQDDYEPADNQAIPFFGDDPLEPDYPPEDFAPPIDTEVVAAAKSTKAKTAKSAKPTKSSAKAPAAEPVVNQVVDRSDEIAQIDVEMRRLGWSKQDGRKHLEETYNKRSRQQLTDDELLAFLAYLQSQPSPSQSPF